jgi:hypothetical protein
MPDPKNFEPHSSLSRKRAVDNLEAPIAAIRFRSIPASWRSGSYFGTFTPSVRLIGKAPCGGLAARPIRPRIVRCRVSGSHIVANTVVAFSA